MNESSPPATLPVIEHKPGTMSPTLQMMLDDKMFDRAKAIAKYLALAEGFVPKNLIGKPEACFAVVDLAITWKLSPYAVARTCYQTPNGQVGFYGVLCQAILENSGMLEGPVRFEHFGEWGKLVGKFKKAVSAKGHEYPVATWTPQDETGLGVEVSAQVKGERDRRTFRFELVQAFPRNSTLWATDPRTQLCYTAVRRFANVAAPGLFMGVPFDREDMVDEYRGGPTIEGSADAVATPRRPTRGAEPAAAGATAESAAEERGPNEDAAEDGPGDAMFELVDDAGVVEANAPDADKWIALLLAASAPTVDGVLTVKANAYLKNNFEAAQQILAGCNDMAAVAALQARYAWAEEQPDPQDDPPKEDKKPAPVEEPTPAADPKPAEAPKAVAMPMTRTNKPDGAKYLMTMQDELLLATAPEHVDAMMARETPNLALVNVGCKNSIVMFAAKCRDTLVKKATPQ